MARRATILRAVGSPAPEPASDVGKRTHVVITAPRIKVAAFRLVGTAPYMQARFTEKSIQKMRATQEAGTQARGKKIRDARSFEDDYKAAMHISEKGWCGIPAGAFRTACVDICRTVGFKMTLAKLSIFVPADGWDKYDGRPLVQLHGTHEMNVAAVRNDNGSCDLRSRPLWRSWHVDLRIEFDEDQFSLTDVTNLIARAGIQCGVGEGRPNSRMSTGCGYGTWRVE